PPFLEAPAQRDRRLVAVPAELREGRWELPLDALERAVTPDMRVFLFCHPHNPLGRVWRREEVETLLDFCRRHDLILASDEIHCDLILDDLGHVPTGLVGPDDADRIVTFMSPSKTFNLPGLNFAYAIVADKALRRRFLRPGEGLLPFPGSFSVAAAEAAYREGAEWHAGLLDYLRGNRDALEAFVAAELPRVRMTHVEATYLAWLDVRELGLSDAPAACREAGVALSAGAAFGDPGFLRLNFGCRRETLDEALRRLATVLA
ncbi:MAG TPA: aminotransferase class I/II-fold pyridoxal phosphate-dependent enzyme, partial [Thermoleophilia bacterium]